MVVKIQKVPNLKVHTERVAKYREWQDPAPSGPRRIEYLPGTTLEPTAQPGLRP